MPNACRNPPVPSTSSSKHTPQTVLATPLFVYVSHLCYRPTLTAYSIPPSSYSVRKLLFAAVCKLQWLLRLPSISTAATAAGCAHKGQAWWPRGLRALLYQGCSIVPRSCPLQLPCRSIGDDTVAAHAVTSRHAAAAGFTAWCSGWLLDCIAATAAAAAWL